MDIVSHYTGGHMAPTRQETLAAHDEQEQRLRLAFEKEETADKQRVKDAFAFRKLQENLGKAAVDGEWMRDASCRALPTEVVNVVFFPPPWGERKMDKIEREERAKAICAYCVVRSECLESALRNKEPIGVWGGLNEKERKDILAVRTDK